MALNASGISADVLSLIRLNYKWLTVFKKDESLRILRAKLFKKTYCPLSRFKIPVVSIDS